MRDERCIIVEELLPLYIEKATGTEAQNLIEQHLKTCKDCNDTYKKMTTDLQITVKTQASNKQTVRYINSIKLWYLICPLLSLIFINFGWAEILRIYEALLVLISACFIASDIFHLGTWWDPECIRQQDEIRENERKKRGDFYIRPLLYALPSVLVVIILELPRIINYMGL